MRQNAPAAAVEKQCVCANPVSFPDSVQLFCLMMDFKPNQEMYRLHKKLIIEVYEQWDGDKREHWVQKLVARVLIHMWDFKF